MRKTSDLTDVMVAELVVEEMDFSGLDIDSDYHEVADLVGHYSGYAEDRQETILAIVRNTIELGAVETDEMEDA